MNPILLAILLLLTGSTFAQTTNTVEKETAQSEMTLNQQEEDDAAQQKIEDEQRALEKTHLTKPVAKATISKSPQRSERSERSEGSSTSQPANPKTLWQKLGSSLKKITGEKNQTPYFFWGSN